MQPEFSLNSVDHSADGACSWRTPDTFPALAANDVHVWCVPLTADPPELKRLQQFLSSDETSRAERFLFEKHRHRFTVGRGYQRELLGRYLGTAPASVAFQYEGLGKPRLANTSAGFCFNFSNSGDLGLLAIALNVELGVDIEVIREVSDMPGLANRFFCGQEATFISAQPGSQRLAAFFRCWTRKEAYLKAIGKGLTVPLNQVVVSLEATDPAEIISIGDSADEAAAWRLAHLQPADGYLGAIALPRHGDALSCWSWPMMPTTRP